MTATKGEKKLFDSLVDFNGSTLADGAEPRFVPTCGDIRDVLSALKAERERADKAEELLKPFANASRKFVGDCDFLKPILPDHLRAAARFLESKDDH